MILKCPSMRLRRTMIMHGKRLKLAFERCKMTLLDARILLHLVFVRQRPRNAIRRVGVKMMFLPRRRSGRRHLQTRRLPLVRNAEHLAHTHSLHCLFLLSCICARAYSYLIWYMKALGLAAMADSCFGSVPLTMGRQHTVVLGCSHNPRPVAPCSNLFGSVFGRNSICSFVRAWRCAECLGTHPTVWTGRVERYDIFHVRARSPKPSSCIGEQRDR